MNTKPVVAARLGLSTQLEFFAYGFFATAAAAIFEEAVSYLADQLGVGTAGRLSCCQTLRAPDTSKFSVVLRLQH